MPNKTSNTFKLGNFTVSIEDGFIPFGKECGVLREYLNTLTAKKGTFSMGFTNNNAPSFKGRALVVNFKAV